MLSMQWSTSHAVFVPEIDDEHKEIFQAITHLEELLTDEVSSLEIRRATQRLVSCVVGHFAHEERLMAAARYGSLRWHKQAHYAARRRVQQFVVRIEQGEQKAGGELVEYLTSWLNDHTGVADRMMGAFLRNHQRCMWKLTFRAGTRPADSCTWVNTNGDKFDPQG
jgi:hemerythrin